MGKLNIAHHKSYHPYRRDNIERVRRDEEEAKLNEEREEGRMMMADAEARLDLLRQRAGSSSSSKKVSARKKDEQDMRRIAEGTQGLIRSQPSDEPLTTSAGHINLFASLESASTGQQQLQLIEKKAKDLAAQREADKGAPLAPSASDLTPWYTDRELKGAKERELEKDNIANDRRQRKQLHSKSEHDPLREMKAHLARRAEVLGPSVPASSSSSAFKAPLPRHPRVSSSTTSQSQLQASSSSTEDDPARSARLSRESSERARALALRARKKRELEAGSETPGSSIADTPRSEYSYSNVFNVQETREAREARERGRGRDRRSWGNQRWDEDHDDDPRRDHGRRYSSGDGGSRPRR